MQHDCTVMLEELLAQGGFSIDRLRTFLAIIEAKGITRAARGDPVRQSQFSRQLKELEIALGSELMKRNRGQIVLTPTGRRLYTIVKHSFSALEELQSECADTPIALSLGAGESLIHWLVLPRLAPLLTRRPRVCLTLRNLTTREIVQGVRDSDLDFGIIRPLEGEPVLHQEKLCNLDYALYVPRSQWTKPIPKPPELLLRELPLAALEGSEQLRQACQAVAQKLRFKMVYALRCTSYPQLAEAVQRLHVAAILPTLAESQLNSSAFTRIDLPSLKSLRRPLRLVWNQRTAVIRPVIESFGKELLAAIRR
jgi:DNA-binding transcriptional LysR family regulator